MKKRMNRILGLCLGMCVAFSAINVSYNSMVYATDTESLTEEVLPAAETSSEQETEETAPVTEEVSEPAVVQEPVEEEPVVEAIPTEAPAAEVPVVEEATVVETPVEETPVETPAAENPSEEPMNEPANEESPVENPEVTPEVSTPEEEDAEEILEEVTEEIPESEEPSEEIPEEKEPAEETEDAETKDDLEESPSIQKNFYIISEIPENAVEGDVMKLRCILEGYEEGTYSLQWQYRKVDWFGNYESDWMNEPGATGTELELSITEENVLKVWRVNLTEFY